MKSVVKIELERAFKNKKMLMVLLIEIALIAYDFYSYGLQIHNKTIPFLLSNASSGKVDNIPGVYAVWVGLHNGQVRTILYSIIPILAAFPYGDSLYKDEVNHYNYSIITRTKRSNYYIAKLAAMFVSGGVCAVFPFILSLMLSMVILPFENVVAGLSYFMSDGSVCAGLFYKAAPLYVIIFLIYTFIVYGLLNCICFIATYVLSNAYIVMITPFCIYYLGLVINMFTNGLFGIPLWDTCRFESFYKAYVMQTVSKYIVLIVLLAVFVWKRIRKNEDIL